MTNATRDDAVQRDDADHQKSTDFDAFPILQIEDDVAVVPEPPVQELEQCPADQDDEQCIVDHGVLAPPQSLDSSEDNNIPIAAARSFSPPGIVQSIPKLTRAELRHQLIMKTRNMRLVSEALTPKVDAPRSMPGHQDGLYAACEHFKANQCRKCDNNSTTSQSKSHMKSRGATLVCAALKSSAPRQQPSYWKSPNNKSHDDELPHCEIKHIGVGTEATYEFQHTMNSAIDGKCLDDDVQREEEKQLRSALEGRATAVMAQDRSLPQEDRAISHGHTEPNDNLASDVVAIDKAPQGWNPLCIDAAEAPQIAGLGNDNDLLGRKDVHGRCTSGIYDITEAELCGIRIEETSSGSAVQKSEESVESEENDRTRRKDSNVVAEGVLQQSTPRSTQKKQKEIGSDEQDYQVGDTPIRPSAAVDRFTPLPRLLDPPTWSEDRSPCLSSPANLSDILAEMTGKSTTPQTQSIKYGKSEGDLRYDECRKVRFVGVGEDESNATGEGEEEVGSAEVEVRPHGRVVCKRKCGQRHIRECEEMSTPCASREEVSRSLRSAPESKFERSREGDGCREDEKRCKHSESVCATGAAATYGSINRWEANKMSRTTSKAVHCLLQAPPREISDSGIGPKSPVPQDLRKAFLNARLAEKWRQGCAWARLDLSGVEISLENNQREVLDEVMSTMIQHHGRGSMQGVILQLEDEWEALKRLRQKYAGPLAMQRFNSTKTPKSILKRRSPLRKNVPNLAVADHPMWSDASAAEITPPHQHLSGFFDGLASLQNASIPEAPIITSSVDKRKSLEDKLVQDMVEGTWDLETPPGLSARLLVDSDPSGIPEVRSRGSRMLAILHKLASTQPDKNKPIQQAITTFNKRHGITRLSSPDNDDDSDDAGRVGSQSTFWTSCRPGMQTLDSSVHEKSFSKRLSCSFDASEDRKEDDFSFHTAHASRRKRSKNQFLTNRGNRKSSRGWRLLSAASKTSQERRCEDRTAASAAHVLVDVV